MQAVLRECTRLGIAWESEMPHALAHKLNRLTGVHTSDAEEPEIAAHQWLMVLTDMPSRTEYIHKSFLLTGN